MRASSLLLRGWWIGFATMFKAFSFATDVIFPFPHATLFNTMSTFIIKISFICTLQNCNSVWRTCHCSGNLYIISSFANFPSENRLTFRGILER